ncbi:hypothetical protein CMV_026078 [Castanea mollissima]|uniref:Uncharacterized protein n=1 Tax=Castanea mollissima TaxID=60419 RepID=A0A8J4QKK0_9ROSI|nr:hypothetical protein CMV_026078 [Castanea mollissima]
MGCVQIVGPEFYGDGCLKPFRSLETLCFDDMQEWRDWIPCKDEYEEFPCLRELSISRCPKLQGKLPRHLSSLVKFSIHECEQLVVSIPTLPKLHEFEIVGCKEVNKSTVEFMLAKVHGSFYPRSEKLDGGVHAWVSEGRKSDNKWLQGVDISMAK